MISIYGLKNPIDNKIFYVGASVNPKSRYSQHCTVINSSKKCDTISGILESGVKPVLVILKENVAHKDAAILETQYIRLYDTGQEPSTYPESPRLPFKDGIRDIPTPIRLGELIVPLQEEAKKLDRSVHWLILSIIKQHPCIQEYLKNKNATNS